jgi:hypothetical protein
LHHFPQEPSNPKGTYVNFILRIPSKWIVFLWLGGSKKLACKNPPTSDKEICMAAPVPDPSGSSAYPLILFLAYALILLSLWRVDMGLVEQQSAASHGDIAMTSVAPAQHDSRSYRRAASLEDLAFGSWGTIPIESENEEVRRKATVALMVYATGNGVRR